MTKIIADCCANHMGDRRIMEAMIRAAADAGVDIVKFQSWKADKLRKDWPDYDNAYKYYKQHELSEDDHRWLVGKCKEYGVEFLTTVFDLETVNFLRRLGLKKVKIASPDANNWALIDKCLKKFDEVILSTGMHSPVEIQEINSYMSAESSRQQKTSFLHCISTYPTKPEEVNMRIMTYNQNPFTTVGFSDHTIGVDAGKLAIALGAEYLEKHFTLSRYLPGKDQAISGTPEEFAELVRWRDLVSIMKGESWRELSEAELANRRLYVGRWSGA